MHEAITDPPGQPAGSRPHGRRAPILPTRSGARAASIIGALAVFAAFVFVFVEMRPDLIFGRGIDVGGDNGGHIAAPYFMFHDLLPRGRLTGWDPWWFDGFPLYVFYFPLPALLVSVLTTVMPYSIAFKIVTALGTWTLPLAGYLFGRLCGFRRPVPVMMAAATLPFLFNTSYTIDGGNVASTMAGEFSFSLAMTTGLLFLGVVAYGLRTGKLRWLAAVLFAITCVCHVIPALAFGGAALIMSIATLRPRSLTRAARVIVPVGIVGALLAAWWLIPFAADLQYSSSMNYGPVTGIGWHWLTDNFFPHGYLFVLVPAGLGAIVSVFQRNRAAFVLALCAALTIYLFHDVNSGLVYNARWLPFWFLFTALLAAYGIGELFSLIGRMTAPSAAASTGMVLVTVGAMFGSVFLGGLEGSGLFGYTAPKGHVQVGGWVSWNYSGIQANSGWPVFQGMIRLLDRAGAEYGCGRLQYEYISETTDPFGSTDTQMSIPMWTNGCMQTTDGIYYESSTTNPFHFLDVSEVSQEGEAPDPVGGLTYPGFNLPDGIRHLQLMGVKYFLAMSPPVESLASIDPSLERIGSVPSFPGPYNGLPVPHPRMVLYLIKHSKLVVPLAHLPEVESVTAQQWLNTNLRWYEKEQYWPTFLARSGPSNWPHARTGLLVPPALSVPAPTTTITDIRPGVESISFHVSRTGTPVLVKIPYFPNWTASGATGPYEVSPNLMAVVPTSHEVSLTYGTSPADWAGKLASLAGVVGLGALMTARPPAPAIATTAPEPPSPAAPAAPEALHETVWTEYSDDEEPAVEQLEEDDTPEEPQEPLPEPEPVDLSVVLPAHNEEELLERTVTDIDAALVALGVTCEILVIENGSSDETADVASRLAAENDHVFYASLPFADYGWALRTGFLVARGRAVVNFDVDYWDADFLGRAVQAISSGRAAVVLASKRAAGATDRRPLSRRVLTAGFSGAMRALLDIPISDAHGMKALERARLLPLVEASTLGGSVFDVEVVVRAHRAGLSILELPADVAEIRPARTGLVRRSLESLGGLLRIRWRLGPDRPV